MAFVPIISAWGSAPWRVTLNSFPTGQQRHTSSWRMLTERRGRRYCQVNGDSARILADAHLSRSASLPHRQTPPIRYTRTAVPWSYDVISAPALHNSISRKHAGGPVAPL
jgi:hypothetical protein